MGNRPEVTNKVEKALKEKYGVPYRRGYITGYDNAFNDIYYSDILKRDIVDFINKELIPWSKMIGKYNPLSIMPPRINKEGS